MLELVIYRSKIRIRSEQASFCLDPDSAGSYFLKRSGSGRIRAEIWPDPDPVSLERLLLGLFNYIIVF